MTSLDTPEHWGAASSGYAAHIAPLMMQTFASEFVDRLDVQDTHKVVEIAAGSGALTQELAKRCASLLATDFSPQMIAILDERMKKAGVGHVTCAVMDGQALELEDGCFDRAACCFGLMLFPDRKKGFKELHRVLRPGGRAMVSGWAGADKFESFALFLGAMKEAFPDLPPPPAPPPVFSLSNLETFEEEMGAAGFCDVEVAYVSRELELPDAPTAWKMMTVGAPPVKALLDRVGAEGEAKLERVFAARIEQRFGGGPVRLTNTATVGCGVKKA